MLTAAAASAGRLPTRDASSRSTRSLVSGGSHALRTAREVQGRVGAHRPCPAGGPVRQVRPGQGNGLRRNLRLHGLHRSAGAVADVADRGGDRTGRGTCDRDRLLYPPAGAVAGHLYPDRREYPPPVLAHVRRAAVRNHDQTSETPRGGTGGIRTV